METCGFKSSFSLSGNLCQEFYKKQKQCSAKPCWWYEKRKSLLQALRSFMERQDAFLCFVCFRLPFLSLFVLSFFHLQQQCWWPELLWSRLDWSASLCIGLLPPIWKISVFTLSLANVRFLIWWIIGILPFVFGKWAHSLNQPKSPINLSSNQIISFLTFHCHRHER